MWWWWNRHDALFFLALCPISVVLGQTAGGNLVVNGSFEDYSACPSGYDTFTINNWNWLYNSPDDFNSCNECSLSFPCQCWNVPINCEGTQNAATGTGYVGLITYSQNLPEKHESLYTLLTEPMQAGYKYRIKLKVSVADNLRFASNCIGVVIANVPPPPPPYQANFSTIEFLLSSAQMLETDTWHEFESIYTSLGGEQNLYIGNFRPWVQTSVVEITPDGGNAAYMYIDDVEVYEDSLVTALPENIEKATAIGYEIGAEALNVSTCGKAELRLMEVTGKVVLVQQLESGRAAVPMAGLPNGVYVARVAYANGQVVSRRVIIGR